MAERVTFATHKATPDKWTYKVVIDDWEYVLVKEHKGTRVDLNREQSKGPLVGALARSRSRA